MSKLLIFFKKLNSAFISVILVVFYFFGIGVASLIYRVFNKEEKTKDTYFQTGKINYEDKKYFESPY